MGPFVNRLVCRAFNNHFPKDISMICRFKTPSFFFLIALTLAIVVSVSVPAKGQTASNTGAEYLRQQSIMEFENWRRDIPDYDKRLYDRVKKVNRRKDGAHYKQCHCVHRSGSVELRVRTH
tara:strand:- start:26 stop:388 length:363 start_codon:yes stop_codon:yes gene_type:complete